MWAKKKSKYPSGIYLQFCRRITCQKTTFCLIKSMKHLSKLLHLSLPLHPPNYASMVIEYIKVGRGKHNVWKHRPEHTVPTMRADGFSVISLICQSSFLFVPAKNHISQHIKSVEYTKWAVSLPFQIWISINSKDTAWLPCFSQFIPTSLVLWDPPFLSRTPSGPSCRSLICHLLLHERRLCMLLFTERTLNRNTAANAGDASRAFWSFFQPMLSHPNYILQLQCLKQPWLQSSSISHLAGKQLLCLECHSDFCVFHLLVNQLKMKLQLYSPLEQWTDIALTKLSVCEKQPAVVSSTRVGGIGRHFPMFPKLIKLFWKSK